MNAREIARGTARAAAIGMATGTVVTVAGTIVLIGLEAVIARSRRYAHPELGTGMRTTVGEATAPPVRIVLLGDATAAGVGVDRVADSVGGQLATLLAGTGRRVELSSVAVAGSQGSDLHTQVARALLGPRPDIAVVLIGSDDAVHLVRPADAALHLGAAVRRLTEAGVAVVAGTCPDLGAARAIAQPLRWVVGRLGRRLGSAQIQGVLDGGGTPVDLAGRTGTVFRADPGTLCWDRYHPSADGYRVWAHALYPAVYAAATAVSRDG